MGRAGGQRSAAFLGPAPPPRPAPPTPTPPHPPQVRLSAHTKSRRCARPPSGSTHPSGARHISARGRSFGRHLGSSPKDFTCNAVGHIGLAAPPFPPARGAVHLLRRAAGRPAPGLPALHRPESPKRGLGKSILGRLRASPRARALWSARQTALEVPSAKRRLRGDGAFCHDPP